MEDMEDMEENGFTERHRGKSPKKGSSRLSESPVLAQEGISLALRGSQTPSDTSGVGKTQGKAGKKREEPKKIKLCNRKNQTVEVRIGRSWIQIPPLGCMEVTEHELLEIERQGVRDYLNRRDS